MSDNERNGEKPVGAERGIASEINRRSFLRMGALAGAAAATVSGLKSPGVARARALRVDEGDDFDVVEATIAELQAAMASGQLTAESLVNRYLARIDSLDTHGPKVNSIIELNPDARSIARALDAERRAHGPRGPCTEYLFY